MSLKFYMDEHVHQAITNGLRQRGIEVLTAQEDGKTGMDDCILLDRAKELGRIVFTYDEDFLEEAARRQRSGEFFAGVIYIHQLQVAIGKCIEELVLIAGVFDPGDFLNHVEYLPLK